MAANRGWLDCSWEDEIDENLVPEPVLEPALVPFKDRDGPAFVPLKDRDEPVLVPLRDRDKRPVLAPFKDIDEVSKGVGEKLVIHQDSVQYDENGAVMEERPRLAKGGKKKKVMEVNETQISALLQVDSLRV